MPFREDQLYRRPVKFNWYLNLIEMGRNHTLVLLRDASLINIISNWTTFQAAEMYQVYLHHQFYTVITIIYNVNCINC